MARFFKTRKTIFLWRLGWKLFLHFSSWKLGTNVFFLNICRLRNAMQCATCNVHCELCNKQCELCNKQCEICNVQCGIYYFRCLYLRGAISHLFSLIVQFSVFRYLFFFFSIFSSCFFYQLFLVGGISSAKNTVHLYLLVSNCHPA